MSESETESTSASVGSKENKSGKKNMMEMQVKNNEKLMERIASLEKQLDKITTLMEKADERAAKAEERAMMAEGRALAAELKLINAAKERESRSRERKITKRRDVSVSVERDVAKIGSVSSDGARVLKNAVAAERPKITAQNPSVVLSDEESDKSTGLQLETAKKRNCPNNRSNVTVQTIVDHERRIKRKALTTRDEEQEDETMQMGEPDAESDEEEDNKSESSVATVDDSEDDTSLKTTSAPIAPAAGDTKKNSPKIVVEDMNTPRFMEYMKRKKVAVETRIIAGNRQTIKCSYENRSVVTDWITKHGKGGMTATPNDERPGCSIVKGIHYSYEAEQIQQELEEKSNLTLKQVRKFQREVKPGQSPLHWWVVSTDTREQALQLRKITHFNGAVISWEPYRASSLLRCYKCNRFNHIARNCLYPARCGRCAKRHETKDCTLDFAAKGTAEYTKITKCCNCKEPGHAAGDMNCKIFIKEKSDHDDKIAKQQQKQPSQKQNVNNSTKQFVPTRSDFDVGTKKGTRGAPAPVLQGQAPKWVANNSSGNQGDLIGDDTRRLFGLSQVEMIEFCRSYANDARRTGDQNQQHAALLSFYSKLYKTN